MFIEARLNVDKLIYSENPPKKFNKKECDKLFDDGWMDMEVPLPPKNSSRTTIQEINEIIDRREMLSDFDKRVYINTNESTTYYIREFLDGQDLEYNPKDIERITFAAKHIGRYYKNKFNRPRPHQVAEALGMDKYTYEKYETTGSPSYPSNHALQARMVAHYYGEKYPAQKKHLLKAANMSAEGRIDAGVHYPSDKFIAYEIADKLVEFFKMDELTEDAPMNATGVSTATDTSVGHIRKKKKKNDPLLKRF